MLKLPLPLTSAPSLTSALLQQTPYISQRCTPLCAILHKCNTPVPLALLQPASLVLFWESCTIAHSTASFASVSTHTNQSLLLLIGAPVARSNPRGWVPRGSCPSSLVVRLATTRCLPTSAQVVRVHSWHSHCLSKLPSLPVLALP